MIKWGRYLPIWRHGNVVAMSYHRNNPGPDDVLTPDLTFDRANVFRNLASRVEGGSRGALDRSRGLSNDWAGTRMASYCRGRRVRHNRNWWETKTLSGCCADAHSRIYAHTRVIHVQYLTMPTMYDASPAADSISIFVLSARRICLVPFVNPFRVPSKFHL